MRKANDTELTPQEAQAAILSPITQALNKHGLTLDRLTAKLSQLTDCTRPAGTDKDGNIIETPDNPSQLKAVDMALKLNQAYPADKHDIALLGQSEMSIAVTVYRREAGLVPSIEDRDEADDLDLWTDRYHDSIDRDDKDV